MSTVSSACSLAPHLSGRNEGLDLLVYCGAQRVVPRDPRGPIYEIE
jgi:hypothetical protein